MTETTPHAPGSDLRDLLVPIWRRRWFVAIVVIATTLAAYAYSDRKPEQYRSSTKIFLQTSELDQTLYGAGAAFTTDRTLVNQASLLQTPAVAQEVAKRIGYDGDPAALLGALTVAPSSGSDFLTVSAVGGSAKAAADLANGFAQAFIDIRAASRRGDVARALDTARRQLASLPDNSSGREPLRTKISSLEAIQSVNPGGARQVDRAVPAGAPFAPEPRRAALFGFVLSLVLAVLAAYGLERLDRRVKHLDEVGPAYGAPVLASLPHLQSGVISRSNGSGPEIVPTFREAVRGLRTNLRLASPDKPLKTFLITSALPGEGKSTLVVNLALAYAEAGLRVAIIECDMRLPTMSKLMDVELSPGLTDVLSGECTLEQAVQRVDVSVAAALQPAAAAVKTRAKRGPWSTERSPLTVLTAGAQPPDPSSVLATQRVAEILDSAKESADIVIIDTPPLLSVTDALPLLVQVDATIVVARIGATDRRAGRRVRDIVSRVPGASLLGVVANDVPPSDLAGEYYSYIAQT